MMLFMLYLFIFTPIVSNEGKVTNKLKKLFEWCPGKIEYVLENKEQLQHLLATGKFIPKNNVPTGLSVHPHKKKMFITCPRWKKGVLSTLNWVPVGTGNLQEPLRPYPCWEANDIFGNSKHPYKIISVIRTYVDSCGRLWVIDSGYDNKVDNCTQIEPPKLLIFDTDKDVLIRKYTFGSAVVELTKSSLGKVVVDVTPDTCNKAFAYITDVTHPGIIVYDYHKNKAFRLEHNFLSMEPMKSTFYLDGKKIYLNVHIDGMCLSGPYTDGYRNLYLSAQSSNKEFITTTKYLRNESYCGSGEEVLYYLGEWGGEGQVGGAQVIDEKTGVMFYSELNSDALSCWNGDHKHFGPQTQEDIVESPEFDYVSDMTITQDRELALMSNQLRKFIHSSHAPTVRVFVGIVDKLIEDTICQYHRRVTETECCHKYEHPIK